VERYLHSPNTPSWLGAQLKKHRDNFTFTFIGTIYIGLSVKVGVSLGFSKYHVMKTWGVEV
jgi:hypothetical protein